jgi:hypothetical protein
MNNDETAVEIASRLVTLVRVSSASVSTYFSFDLHAWTPATNSIIIRNHIVTSCLRRAMAPHKKPAAASKPKLVKPAISSPNTPLPTALPPSRDHLTSYHYPLLMTDKRTCDALLNWFESVEETRSMPWRKKWIDPSAFAGKDEELASVLGKRAYEVWVSEVSK